MKILYTSDIHTSANHLSSLILRVVSESPDVLIIGGDIIPHQLPEQYTNGILMAQEAYLKTIFLPVMEELKRKHNIRIFLDLGNDDFISGRKLLEARDGHVFRLLHMRRHELTRHIDVFGYMVVPPTPFQRKDWEKPDASHFPYAKNNQVILNGYRSYKGNLEAFTLNLSSDDTIEQDLFRLEKSIDKPFILVSHSPPYDTPLDVLANGQHVGSLSLRKFIEKWSDRGLLIASLHGHIHEAPIRSGTISTKIGQTLCINPGQHSGHHADLRYVVLELEQSVISPTVRITNPAIII
jgi:Icc-related predicted phosphoesterase